MINPNRAYDIRGVRADGETVTWDGVDIKEAEGLRKALLEEKFRVTLTPIYAFGEGFYGDGNA